MAPKNRFIAIPTRRPSPRLDELVAIASRIATVLILHHRDSPGDYPAEDIVRHQENYAAWFNQAAQEAQRRGGTEMIFMNDDYVIDSEGLESMFAELSNAHIVAVDNDSYRGIPGEFSGDCFAVRIGDVWLDQSYNFHWADVDMQFRAMTQGLSISKISVETERHSQEMQREGYGWLQQFHDQDAELMFRRWGWLLRDEVEFDPTKVAHDGAPTIPLRDEREQGQEQASEDLSRPRRGSIRWFRNALRWRLQKLVDRL